MPGRQAGASFVAWSFAGLLTSCVGCVPIPCELLEEPTDVHISFVDRDSDREISASAVALPIFHRPTGTAMGLLYTEASFAFGEPYFADVFVQRSNEVLKLRDEPAYIGWFPWGCTALGAPQLHGVLFVIPGRGAGFVRRDGLCGLAKIGVAFAKPDGSNGDFEFLRSLLNADSVEPRSTSSLRGLERSEEWHFFMSKRAIHGRLSAADRKRIEDYIATSKSFGRDVPGDH